MAQCTYCGQSAGLMRKVHAKCHNRHARALSLIAEFLPKFFESRLHVDRFRQIIEDAAKSAFIKPEELKSLFVAALEKMINGTLEQQLLSNEQIQRITETIDALASIIPDDAYPHETIAKVNILRELTDGNVPELVAVAGPMPIELRPGETVIWIFNYVTTYQEAETGAGTDAPQPGIELPLDGANYFGLNAFKNVPVPRDTLQRQTQGDLVVTNRRLYFLIDEAQYERIPLGRLVSLRAYADGVQINCGPVPEYARIFVLDDAWFAANLLVCLSNYVRKRINNAVVSEFPVA